jgi:transcriptional regulator with XRE-family HTH domain
VAVPSSSSVQQARQELADQLRELRLDAGLSARELGNRAGWGGHSKVSRIEHGRTVPTQDDIAAWCTACDAPGRIADLVAATRALDTMWTDYRRLHRSGLRAAQESVVPLWERTRRFRIYSPWLIPGPVQTPAYVRALLTATRARQGIQPDDIEDAVAARMAKQHVVHEGDHRFAILLEENVLRHRIGGAHVLADALEHLLMVMSAPSIALGIIPSTVDRVLLRPVEMFFLFDREQVSVELISGWLRITRPGEIAMYEQAFALLNQVAVSGRRARALIHAALADLPE